jgi:hypothetical protein
MWRPWMVILTVCLLCASCQSPPAPVSAAPPPPPPIPPPSERPIAEQGGGISDFVGTPENAGDDVKPFFYVDMSGIWPTYNINVCWEPGADNFAAEKTLVTTAVEEHIQRNSRYRFAGWGPCDQSQSPRIRIVVRDLRPVSEVGYQQQPSILVARRSVQRT